MDEVDDSRFAPGNRVTVSSTLQGFLPSEGHPDGSMTWRFVHPDGSVQTEMFTKDEMGSIFTVGDLTNAFEARRAH